MITVKIYKSEKDFNNGKCEKETWTKARCSYSINALELLYNTYWENPTLLLVWAGKHVRYFSFSAECKENV